MYYAQSIERKKVFTTAGIFEEIRIKKYQRSIPFIGRWHLFNEEIVYLYEDMWEISYADFVKAEKISNTTERIKLGIHKIFDYERFEKIPKYNPGQKKEELLEPLYKAFEQLIEDESIENESMKEVEWDELVKQIIGHTLNDAFENVSKVLLSVKKNNKITNEVIEALKETVERVLEKNVFHNSKIEEIRLELLEVFETRSNIEVMAEKAEYLLANIYGYSGELGIENLINLYGSPLSADELMSIYSILKKNKAQNIEVS